MALLSWVDPFSKRTHAVEFDATVAEEMTFSSDVTRSPREKGVSTTDHVEPLPDSLRLEGVVTNTPIELYTDGDHVGPIVSAYLPLRYEFSTKRLLTGAH